MEPLHAPQQLCTYGWLYNDRLDADDNYLDLALCVSRNSRCEGGHMGCVLVKPKHNASKEEVLTLSINSTLFDPESCKSDVHAEQNAISVAAREGKSLQGATAYITMPPCRTCFGLLQAAGVKRVVYRRRNHLPEMDAAAERLGIAMVGDRGNQKEDESLDRVRELWHAYRLAHPEEARKEDDEVKEVQRLAKEAKKRRTAERAAEAEAAKRAKTAKGSQDADPK